MLCCLLPLSLAAQDFPFRDTALTREQRVEDLLGRLTLEEKLSMMQHNTPAVERLGLKPYSWWNEALHGVGRNGTAHVYPMPIALAATFNPQLVRLVFEGVAQEALHKYAQSQRDNRYGDNTGLSFFAPNINIFRDPRWGRGMETFGEDPYLTAMMGLATVRGLQGDDTEKLVTAACVKHLAAHSGPEGLRHEFDATVSPRDLWCTYLPAFRYIVERGRVAQVMCGYNRLNGEPCCTNDYLLGDVLRRRWGFDGLIVTDCWALNDCWERDTIIPRHKTHATAALTAQAAFGHEVDLECGSGLPALRTAVDSGYIAEEKINEHVRRILSLRLRLQAEEKAVATANELPCDLKQQLSQQAAEAALQSIVLLKNGHVATQNREKQPLLPLQQSGGEAWNIAVLGPNRDDSLMALGNYNGYPERSITILQGLEQAAAKRNSRIVFSHTACGHTQPAEGVDARFWKKIDKSDLIVFVGGLSPALEGEELKVEQEGFYKGDRTQIELPAAQRDMLKELRHRTDKPIILILCTGSAIALEEVVDEVDAIVVSWYGGEAMGSAVAQALFEGPMNGHLPVTFYKNSEQLPPFDDYSMQRRTYRYLEEKPLYPFGYGLGYAQAEIDTLWYDAAARKVRGRVKGGAPDTLNNKLLLQVYLKGYLTGEDADKTLVAFQWITLPMEESPHTGTEFAIPLDAYWLNHYDPYTEECRPFKYGTPLTLQVGTSSADKDLQTLPIVWQ